MAVGNRRADAIEEIRRRSPDAQRIAFVIMDPMNPPSSQLPLDRFASLPIMVVGDVIQNRAVQDVPLDVLQRKLRAQRQVVDFVPNMPERCDKLNGPPEF